MLKATGRLTLWPYLRLLHHGNMMRISSKSTISAFRTMMVFSMKTLMRSLQVESVFTGFRHSTARRNQLATVLEDWHHTQGP